MWPRHYEVEMVSFKDDGSRVARKGLLTDDLDQARRRAAHLWRLGVYASVKVIEVEWHGVRCIRRDVVLARGATERPQPYPAAAE